MPRCVIRGFPIHRAGRYSSGGRSSQCAEDVENLTVDTSGAVGVISAVLDVSSFTAPAEDTLDTNLACAVLGAWVANVQS